MSERPFMPKFDSDGMMVTGSSDGEDVDDGFSVKPMPGMMMQYYPEEKLSYLPKESHATEIRYSDGVGNTHAVWINDDDKVEYVYDPITPMESSSGTYSGGEPVHHVGVVTRGQYDKLVAALQAAILNTGDHAKSRMKGTGIATRIPKNIVESANPNFTESLVLQMSSGSTQSIGAILAEMKKATPAP